jgi:DNA-directed RNA polymerase subunit RPC12/RpoP
MEMFNPRERCAKCGSKVKIKEFTKMLPGFQDYLILKCIECNFEFKRRPLSESDKGELK